MLTDGLNDMTGLGIPEDEQPIRNVPTS